MSLPDEYLKCSKKPEIDSESKISECSKSRGKNRFGFDPDAKRINTGTFTKKDGKTINNRVLVNSPNQLIKNQTYSPDLRPSTLLRGTFNRNGKSGVKVQDGENGGIAFYIQLIKKQN